ncbi:hypothetical protein BMF94_6428 [Rhodotorula taiwanensis]|uniref:Uncharacterized protein n=1 Tax=Rhodotorula taiwanensis TaxID=741276 RepID=A0A2S5B145_9BASI|nr:hypothetical protein BMF94_6428 [Rhodotorula taiwanensis]
MDRLESLEIQNFDGVVLGGRIHNELRYWRPDRTGQAISAQLRRFKQELRPALPPGWTKEGVARLVEAVDANNIQINAKVKAFITWEADCDAQIEQYLVERAFETNDLETLIAYYGRQGAAAAIRRQRTELIELLAE